MLRHRFSPLAACFSENWRHASSALSVSLSRNLPIKALPTFASVPAFWEILTLSVPLTLNRMLVNLLQSTEANLDPRKTRSIRTYKRAVPQSVWRTDRYGHYPLFYFLLRPRPPSPRMRLPTIAGQQAAGKEDAIIRSTEQTIQYCLWLGFYLGRNLLLFRKKTGTDLLQKPGRRHLFTDSGISLSFPLSHRHSDRDPERPGTHRPMPHSEPRRPWNPNPLRDLRNPPHGNPRLPLRTAFKPAYHYGIKPDLFT